MAEKIFYMGGKPNVRPFELARMDYEEGGLILKVNELENIGINPDFLEKIVRSYDQEVKKQPC